MPYIKFLFVLIILVTACTPNATLAPLPTITLSPVASATATIATTPTPSPISPENLKLLTKAGYSFYDGKLHIYEKNVILTLDGNNWRDEMGDVFPSEELKLIQTNGVDFEGRNVLILSREINGEKKIFLPLIETWVTPIDVAASQAVIDANPIVPTYDNWGDYEYVNLEALPEITWADYTSGRLFLSEQLELRMWPANVRVPTLQYIRLSMITNVWTLF